MVYVVTAKKGSRLLQMSKASTEHGARNVAVAYLHAYADDQDAAIAVRPLFQGPMDTARVSAVVGETQITIEEWA